MKRTSLLSALILCLLIGLTACSSPGQDESTTPNQDANEEIDKIKANNKSGLIEPEQVISKDEAETLLGEPVQDCSKSENEVVGQKLCFYDVVDENSFRFLQIAITQQTFMPADSPNTPASIYATTRDTFGEDAQLIDGLGDEAMLISGGYYILNNGYLLQISAGNTDDADILTILDQASALALDNLKALQ